MLRVVRYAKRQNVIAYGAVTEGYDRDTDFNVVTSVPTRLIGTTGATGTLSYTLQGPVSGVGRKQVRIILQALRP